MVSQQHIAQYESGKRVPKIETLQKIAAALGVPWNVFISDIPQSEQGELLKTGVVAMVEKMNFETELVGNWLDLTKDIVLKKQKYINLYDELNQSGQDKAIEHVEMLTKIPEYRKDSE